MEKVGKNPTRIAKHAPLYAIFVLERETRELPARGKKIKKTPAELEIYLRHVNFHLQGFRLAHVFCIHDGTWRSYQRPFNCAIY